MGSRRSPTVLHAVCDGCSPFVAFAASEIRVPPTHSSTTTTGMSPSVPKIITTPPQRPRSSSTPLTPQEILRSPAARRMSRSSTPQTLPSDKGLAPFILSHPQKSLAALIATVMSTGIMISIVYGTSLDTSSLSLNPSRTAFFARKSNFINQLFVKKSWGWTSLIYVLHLITAPSSNSAPRVQRMCAFGIASTAWLIFTTWFFGAGLGDRVIAFSGGACAVPLPNEWDLDPSVLQPLLPDNFPKLLTATTSDLSSKQLYLPLPASFCSLRIPLTPKTHPELFSLLSSSSISFPLSSQTNTLHPTDSHPPLSLPTPRWSNGFDISGHAFLLTLASLLLVRELAPSWRAWAEGRQSAFATTGGLGRKAHRYITLAGTALLALWVWMLLMTSIYFHNPPEKLTGLVTGLSAAYLVHILTPTTKALSTVPISAHVTSRKPISDENAARRGEEVIMEEDEDALLPSPSLTSNRAKAE